MAKPTLVVLAAGMGSRYGGLKQIDPVGPNGEIIIDYSIYDAYRAGFRKIVFIIKKAIAEDFIGVIGRRTEQRMEVHYVYQEIESLLPAGFAPDPARKKPWGTAHALMCCRDVLDGPFAVINADDYYGRHAFELLYQRLLQTRSGEPCDFSMVGYLLDNTLTDHGHVARGVCNTNAAGQLVDIMERTHVVRAENGPAYSEDGGKTLVSVPRDNLVSMNMWGFSTDIFPALFERFPDFLAREVPQNPTGAEYFIPMEVGRLLRAGRAQVEVLTSPDRWFGVTYREDKPVVEAGFKRLTEAGVYPSPLF